MTNPWRLPSFNQTIELADGTVLNGRASLNSVSDELWVWLKEDTTMPMAFSIFSDATKTRKIISHTGITETFEWEGYTNMTLIKEDAGKVTIRMKEP